MQLSKYSRKELRKLFWAWFLMIPATLSGIPAGFCLMIIMVNEVVAGEAGPIVERPAIWWVIGFWIACVSCGIVALFLRDGMSGENYKFARWWHQLNLGNFPRTEGERKDLRPAMETELLLAAKSALGAKKIRDTAKDDLDRFQPTPAQLQRTDDLPKHRKLRKEDADRKASLQGAYDQTAKAAQENYTFFFELFYLLREMKMLPLRPGKNVPWVVAEIYLEWAEENDSGAVVVASSSQEGLAV